MFSKTILLVDDSRDDRELIGLAIEKAGIQLEVETVVDGTELADYLFAVGDYTHRDVRQMPDLILLDLKMPKLDGCQTLQMLRRVRGQPHLPPVVVFTSSDNEQDIADAYCAGANSYIRKPIDSSEFIEIVRRVVGYWIDLNLPPPTHRHLNQDVFI